MVDGSCWGLRAPARPREKPEPAEIVLLKVTRRGLRAEHVPGVAGTSMLQTEYLADDNVKLDIASKDGLTTVTAVFKDAYGNRGFEPTGSLMTVGKEGGDVK